MWNFDAIKKIDKLEEERKKWQSETQQEIQKLHFEILELSKKSIIPQEQNANIEIRLKELELWQSKLHSLMIEKTPANKEKISRNYSFLKGRI